ncbi:hypothetical protein QTG54_015430 [Skeletonema marinoi]|uniref:Uncharacterized protein n=1 Tax=Skeletonema marinoi TaxID=267567 RepID=A0AAD9D5Q8_9STRA|nr:hypothetical protein QTG54_015430 [Skeletonema marinoi]
MVLRNDEPDIIVGGPSAPPIATAVPAGGDDPSAPRWQLLCRSLHSTTLTKHREDNKCRRINRHKSYYHISSINGYRDVTIEYFYVPANMAGTVIMSMDSTGEPPSSLYLTKMEQQVLPPGTGEVMSHAPSSAPQTTGAATAVGGNNPVPQPYIHENAVVGGSQRGSWVAVFGCVCIIIVAVGIVGGVRGINNTQNPIIGLHPPRIIGILRLGLHIHGRLLQHQILQELDARTRLVGQINMVSNVIGMMGLGLIPACAALVSLTKDPWPSAYTEPTHSPASACKDTPNWVDLIGLRCDTYTENDFMCDSADTYMGDMGPAAENCCACGGGAVSYTPPPPATSNTAISTPTPTNPAELVRRRKTRE